MANKHKLMAPAWHRITKNAPAANINADQRAVARERKPVDGVVSKRIDCITLETK
jgi:hypothetical protein